MRITGLEIDGYGVWTGLRLEGLSEGLNVFFGPNEAGKTTLMQFLRSVLYGFTAERERYLPPLRGGRPGGSVHVAGPNGSFQVSRHQNEEDPDGADEVSLAASDGTRQGGHLLPVLLSNVDEAIFNNVFAVGLEELQQLAVLDDTEAASLLYSLSAGLDRVALVDVVRELESSRNRLLSANGRPCRVTELLAEREKLCAEIDQLDELTHRYLRLAGEREQLQRETTRLEEEANELRHQVRVVEIAAAVGERWERRKQLDDQLAALGPVSSIPEEAFDELDAAVAALEKGAERMDHLRLQWNQLRAEAAELNVNQALWRLAPRIEALAEQESWIATLRTRSSELETEITDLEAQLSAEQERLGLGKHVGTDGLPSVSSGTLRALRGPAREVRSSRQRLEETEQQAAAARETARSLGARIEAALSARGHRNLAEAMDQAGSLVAQLRRRAQLDERLDQMDYYQGELEEQSRDLLKRQVLPVAVLMGLGGVFVVSVILVMAGLFMPKSITGSFSWLLALLGLGGLAAAVATKFLLERSNARRLEGCQNQLHMLQRRIKEAKRDRAALDEQLSIGDGSVTSRLEAAEEALARLEELVPLDAQRKAAKQEAEEAEGRARQLQGEAAAARRRWQEALSAVGLPPRLSPKQVRDLATGCDQLREVHRRLESRYEEYDARRRELEALTGRIDQLAAETNLPLESHDPIERIRALARQVSDQEAKLQRRQALRARARQLRRKRAKCLGAIRRLEYRRDEVLRRAGIRDEQEFRQCAAQLGRARTLRREQESLDREIDAAVAGHCPLEAVAEQLQAGRAEGLDERYQAMETRLHATEARLQERFEKRGQLSEQLKALAEDQRPAAKRLELALVDKRLEEAVHRWRVLAVTSRILSGIRTRYEKERQPETLKEASGYLARLTEARYRRVWTPLDRDVLLVDDAEGRSLPVELLSRGAREQLFLCLRLALAGSFARRGAQLPLVLDDVLVNFDNQRAKAAVALLRDFAKAGHQLLVFTCHEHISKLFRSLRVPVSRLPRTSGLEASARSSRKQTKRRGRRRSPPQPTPHELVAESEPEVEDLVAGVLEAPGEEHVHEIVVDDIVEEDVRPVVEPAAWNDEEDDELMEPVADDEQEEHYGASAGDFGDLGSYDDHGVKIADFVVRPAHDADHEEPQHPEHYEEEEPEDLDEEEYEEPEDYQDDEDIDDDAFDEDEDDAFDEADEDYDEDAEDYDEEYDEEADYDEDEYDEEDEEDYDEEEDDFGGAEAA